MHRCNDAGEAARVLSRDLGGCSFEQEGDNFYVVGADAVRKKLCNEVLSAGPFNGTDYDVKKVFPDYYADRILGQNLFFMPTSFYAAHNGATFAVTSTYNKSTGVLSVRSNTGGINGATIYIVV